MVRPRSGSTESDSPAELRLAVVGCGAISGWHVDALAEVPRVRITAAVDVDQDRAVALAARTGAATFATVSDALSASIFDAALVLVPPHVHEQVSVELLHAGRHVMLEKPIANSLAEAERIIAAADDSGRVLMVAENAQYWPSVRTACDLIRAGAIGEVVTARAARAQHASSQWYGGDRAWRRDRGLAGGGIALDIGTHWIRPLRMMLGEIDEVVAALGHPYPEMEGESLVRSLLRFRSGVVASFDSYVVSGATGDEPVFRITGTTGELTVGMRGSVQLFDEFDPHGREVGDGRGYMASYALEHRDFAAALLDGTPLDADPAEAVGELRVALAIYRSAETGTWAKVGG